jgi:hypothetical protein
MGTMTMAVGIFVTEMDRLDYQGGAIVNAVLNGQYYKKAFAHIQAEFPEYDWHELKLSETLDYKEKPDLIIVSRNVVPFISAIKQHFPEVKVADYDTWAKQK